MSLTTDDKDIDFDKLIRTYKPPTTTPDEAYTLGLFHDCGIPILMEKYDDYAQTIQSAYNAEGIRITQIEKLNMYQ